MSRILPRAVSMSGRGGGLAEALAPAVERALAIGGKRDGRGMSEALAPVVIGALCKAFGAAITRGFLAINRIMLKYCSVTGLRWRIEARRAGVPFEQVFRQHTRNLPVKQVFLIHRETGILLQQAQSEVDNSRDWDVVTGMLTAIGDFIHDSFSVGKDEQLETIRVGDLTIVIEQGEHAALAGILRGDAPADLRERFRSALARIHGEFAHELEGFRGETSVFEKSSTFLESCLQALVSTDQMHILPQTILVALIPIFVIGGASFVKVKDHYQWRAYIADLTGQSGIVVMQEGRHVGRHFVYGLRDPAAGDPEIMLLKHGFSIEGVESRWAPFQALRAPVTLQRLNELLNPPESISMEMDKGMLVMRGAASQEWIEGALAKLKNLSGLLGYQTDSLVVTDVGDYRKWDNYLQRLEREPGLVVLKSGRRGGRFFVYGLRDPLARDPAAMMGEFGIASADVESGWEAYQALHPTLVLERARQVLAPPAGVTLDLREGVLAAKGRAAFKWIDRAQALSRSVAGVQSFDTSGLVDLELEEVNAIKGQIEAEAFRFLVGAPDLWPGQGGRLEALVANIGRLQRAATRRDQHFKIEIRGYTDGTGDLQRDMADSQELANSFYENIRWRSIDMSLFDKRGMGAAPPPATNDGVREAKNRLVSLKVIFDPA